MRVLFFAHPAVLEKSPRAREWIDRFAGNLGKLGHEITFFDPLQTRLKERAFDVIQVFSNDEPEIWSQLSSHARALVVTPAIDRDPPSDPGIVSQAFGQGLRILRAIRQRKWPPVDQVGFHQSPAHFLVTSPLWQSSLRSGASRIPGRKVTLMTEDAESAARIADRVYRESVLGQGEGAR